MPDDLPEAAGLTWRDLPTSPAADSGIDTEMAARGMQRKRTLVSLRRPLPLDGGSRTGRTDITTRAFDPGRDTDDLLEVNNAAFAWHPDQGGWDRARLAEALAQRWVEPEGILVHEGPAGTLDGFCWTRIHSADDHDVLAAGDPPLGEIWVIGAHPSTHGSGLGPGLVAAGLDHLESRGLRTAVLWTEEDNMAARTMYDRMGFTVHRRRGGYA